MNHARALAEGGDANLLAFSVRGGDLQPREGGLLDGIGSHDRLSGLLEVAEICAQMGGQSRQRGDDFFSR